MSFPTHLSLHSRAGGKGRPSPASRSLGKRGRTCRKRYESSQAVIIVKMILILFSTPIHKSPSALKNKAVDPQAVPLWPLPFELTSGTRIGNWGTFPSRCVLIDANERNGERGRQSEKGDGFSPSLQESGQIL